MKETLTEIKNNLQGNSCRVDEAKNDISDLNTRKQKQAIRTRRKKNPKKNEDSISIPLHHGVPEGEEKEQEIGNLFEKNNERKLP